MLRVIAVILAVALLLGAASAGGDVNYRKPPFNGSIFGKRNALGMGTRSFPGQEDRNACEILLDACGQVLQNVMESK